MNKKIENVELLGMFDALEKEASKIHKGKIVEIVPITNSDYFNEKGMFGEKKGYSLRVVIDDLEKIEFTQWFSKPDVKGLGFKQSNLYAFYKKYGCEPIVDLEVDVKIDDNGFYRIVI